MIVGASGGQRRRTIEAIMLVGWLSVAASAGHDVLVRRPFAEGDRDDKAAIVVVVITSRAALYSYCDGRWPWQKDGGRAWPPTVIG